MPTGASTNTYTSDDKSMSITGHSLNTA